MGTRKADFAAVKQTIKLWAIQLKMESFHSVKKT